MEFVLENLRDGISVWGQSYLQGHSADIPGLLILSGLEGSRGRQRPPQSVELHDPLVGLYFGFAFPSSVQSYSLQPAEDAPGLFLFKSS